MNSYMLSYDLFSVAPFHEQLAAFVKANRNVSQWAHPYAGVYLLKSEALLFQVNASFAEFFAGKTLHILTPLTAQQTQGVLPQWIWEWINAPDPVPLNSLWTLMAPQDRPG